MPKEEWGVKRLCPHCASRFYDLTKDPMTCPVCGNSFSAESLTSGRSRSLIAEKTTTPDQVDVDDLTDDDDIDSDAGDVDLDDDLLDEDDDDNVSLDDIADVSNEDDDN